MRRGDRSADERPLGPQRNSFVSRDDFPPSAQSGGRTGRSVAVMPARLRVYRALSAVRHATAKTASRPGYLRIDRIPA